MPSPFDTAIAAGLKSAMDFIGRKAITIGGLQYQADVDEIGNEGYELELGGRLWSVQIHALVERTAFANEAAIPKPGAAVLYNSRKLQVINRFIDGAAVRFKIGTPEEA